MTALARRVGPVFHLADPARLEPVKWLAFLAMVCDHLALTLLPSHQWLRQIGTFAFPAFALSFGIGLAATNDPLRVAKRLIGPAIVAQLSWVAIFAGWHPLNVLVMFASCAFFLELGRTELRVMFGTVLVVALTYLGFEGGFMGFLLVGGAYLAASRGSVWWMFPPVAVWAALQPSVGFVLGVLAVLFAPRLSIQLPRRPGALAWAYAGHLWLLAMGALYLLRPEQ